MRSNNWTVTTLVPLKGDNSPSPSRQLLLCGAIALYFGSCFSFSELWIEDLVKESTLVSLERTKQTYQNHQLKNGRSRFSEWTVKVGRLFYRPTCILCSNPPDSQGQYHVTIHDWKLHHFSICCFCRTWCFHQVWEAGSGEGLSIALQAQELAMLVIGCIGIFTDTFDAIRRLRDGQSWNVQVLFRLLSIVMPT